MSMVLSRMPVLTSLKVKKNVKIMIAKSIFRIIMIMIPILWMRIRVILQLLTSWRFSHKMMNSEYWTLVTLVELKSQGFFVGSWVRLLPDEEDERGGKREKSWHNISLKAYGIFRGEDEIFQNDEQGDEIFAIRNMWTCQIRHQFSPTKPRCWFQYFGNVF